MRFVPQIVWAKRGDTIAFRTMETQWIEPVPGMWPEDVPEIRSDPGADVDFKTTADGVYVIRSVPHWGAHMGVVLVVGQPPNLAATISSYLEATRNDKEAKPAAVLLRRFQEQTEKR